MNPKILHNLIWLPMFILGSATLILGISILAGVSNDNISRGGLFLLGGLILLTVTLKTMMGTPRVRRITLVTIALFGVGYLLVPGQTAGTIAPSWFFYTAVFLTLLNLWATSKFKRHDS